MNTRILAVSFIVITFISLSAAAGAKPISPALTPDRIASAAVVAHPVPATTQPPQPQPTTAESDRLSSAEQASVDRFTNAIAIIKDFYVDPVTNETLLDNAIRGLVSGLDPHSEYLDGDDYKTLLMTTSGEFGGVGIEVTPDLGILKVVAPLDDSPAAKAAIKSGDYIVAINGQLVSEMPLETAVNVMRGKPNTQVTLTILRKGEKAPLIFKLKREVVHLESVKSRMLDNHFGYIRISEFQEPTPKLMQAAILQLKTQNKGNLSGLVLDLRDDPGGLLDSAVQVVNSFLNSQSIHQFNKLIVYTVGRLPEAQYSAKATGTDMLNGAPLVVLINSGSASASEIVAGALQDYHRAMIVGMTSFGKGSVQTVIPLDKTHAIKLTTALYHTPSGRVIQDIGIIPDITVDDFKLVTNQISDEEAAMVEPIKEYQLKNHLPGTAVANTNNASANINDAMLANQDFQLFQALKILRTMAMVDQFNGLTTQTVAAMPAQKAKP